MKRKEGRRERRERACNEQRIVSGILLAAFTGKPLSVVVPTIWPWSRPESKKYAVDIFSDNRQLVRLLLTQPEISNVFPYGTKGITPNEALEFFNKYKARAVYPKF